MAETWSPLMKGSTIATGIWYDRGGQKVCKFTPHYMQADFSAEDCAKMFRDEGQASSNYCIGSNGTIWGCVPEEYGAWTSSSNVNDKQAITVEVANVNTDGEITQAAWNSLVALGADICSRYGFSLNFDDTPNGSLTYHYMFNSKKDCPGKYIRAHTDQLINEINSKIGSATLTSSSSSTSTSGGSTSSGSSTGIPEGVINLEFSYGYNDGQMSDIHRGFMSEYNIEFDASGARLTIEGRQTESISFKDPNSVTYKGMTIEEIIRSIAEEEGWIIDDDSIEPIAEVKESKVYTIAAQIASNSLSDLGNVNMSGGTVSNFNDVCFVGDSMMARIKARIESEFPGATVLAKSGGTFDDTIMPNLDKVGNAAKVVIGWGNNDGGGITMDMANKALAKVQGKQVYLITMLVTNNSTSTTTTNQTNQSLASSNPNIKIIDWYGNASKDPGKYILDNVHQSDKDGVDLYIKLLHDALGTIGSGGGGGGSEGSLTPIQQKVVEIANSHGFAGYGYCEMWAEEVWEQAGIPRERQPTAADTYKNFCTSSNKADLRTGMAVAVAPSGGSGNPAGHVGIYIGNNNVRHNGAEVRTDSLDKWIATYGPEGSHPHSNPVKWGWYVNRDLTKG